MKLGEFFKNYNIRVANFHPSKQNFKIYNTNLNPKIFKNFLDLRKFFDQKNIVVRNFYIPDLGTIPFNLKINEINNFIEYSKKKSTINFKLKDSFQILNNNEYSDVDWYLRSMKNILLHVKENNFLGNGVKLDSNISISSETLKGKFSVTNPNINIQHVDPAY